jgi:hypothetical protein
VWAETESLGVFELEERNGKYYVPNGSKIQVMPMYKSKEEATIKHFNKLANAYNKEKLELEKRIRNIDKKYLKMYKLLKVDELKKTHPEHFMNIQ